jgi:ribosomal protein S18 acetylase RimI-like enzyme
MRAGALPSASSPPAAATIAAAGLLDLPAIRRVERACFPADAYDLLTLLGLALNPRARRLKAITAEGVVGFSAGEVHSREGLGWIITIGVVPDCQGRGIGRSLLARIERAMGMPRVKLTVRRGNQRAIHVYEQGGYQRVATARAYYHDGEDGLIMQKELW